jgi:hypothetical protein
MTDSTKEKLMTRPTCSRPLGILAAFAIAIMFFLFSTAPARATGILFSETFNGYTSFPSEHPAGDPINPGLPEISEGADELWYGGRFQTPDSGTIQQDLAVQKIGGSPNNTPVGRAEDEAGLLFNISTMNCLTVTLDYDWRLFSGGATDKIRVGYFVGNITGFAADRTKSMVGTWGSWTELLVGNSNSWQHATHSLPAGQASVWVAFWLDNGEGDFAKIDNITVTCEEVVVPEPSAVALAGVAAGVVGCAALRRRIRKALGVR